MEIRGMSVVCTVGRLCPQTVPTHCSLPTFQSGRTIPRKRSTTYSSSAPVQALATTRLETAASDAPAPLASPAGP